MDQKAQLKVPGDEYFDVPLPGEVPPRQTAAPAAAAATDAIAAPPVVTAPRAIPLPRITPTADRAPLLVEPNLELLEREKILPPGAGGPNGAAYKMLRTQVLKRLDKLGANTLAVISAMPGSGKTLTAINLAIAIAAEYGRTALLVDFDFRHPCIHKRLGLEPRLGIEECLRSQQSIANCMIRLTGYPRLTIVPARERIEDSSELLAAERTVELMLEMRSRYTNRVLIFDLPPVLLADDALAFAKYVQAGLVVVAEGQTRRQELTRAMRLLQDLPIVGTVLNGSREPAPAPY
jgi:protein-tyrosine kinase